jgi:predicted RNA binding protein YcfA (HicA-like mRNA interferase family)
VSKVPVVSYQVVVNALARDGWSVIRQRGSHIRIEKRSADRSRKLVIPAHNPVKRATLANILKQAEMDVDRFISCSARC